MSDRLAEAVHATRYMTSGEQSGAACYTRSRVLAAVRQRTRRRVVNLTFGIPLTAILMGPLAWAASGRHLTVLVHSLSVKLSGESAQQRAQPVSRHSAPRRQNSEIAVSQSQRDPAPAASADPLEPALTVVTAASSAKAPGPTTTMHASRPDAAPRDNQATERELLLYESAHHAHFNDRNWSAALAAWDEYLRSAPHGRLAMEAKYNRALCLVRLGRTKQALSALQPFVQGAAGNYRQREALDLFEQLGRDAP